VGQLAEVHRANEEFFNPRIGWKRSKKRGLEYENLPV
jgi:hypothetical protein